MTAEDIKKSLGLVPHPREGGWYVRTYESAEIAHTAPISDARYSGPRPMGTAIYYLLEHDSFSEMHRLKSDELFHFYCGDPVEMLQLSEGEPGRVVRLGPNLLEGERPQVVVPRGVWQGSHLVPGGTFALLGCTVCPGFHFDDYEAGDRAQLTTSWPHHRALIEALTRASSDRVQLVSPTKVAPLRTFVPLRNLMEQLADPDREINASVCRAAL